MVCTLYNPLYNRLYDRLDGHANEPSQAALERASQDVYDVNALQCGWTVENVTRLTE